MVDWKFRMNYLFLLEIFSCGDGFQEQKMSGIYWLGPLKHSIPSPARCSLINKKI